MEPIIQLAVSLQRLQPAVGQASDMPQIVNAANAVSRRMNLLSTVLIIGARLASRGHACRRPCCRCHVEVLGCTQVLRLQAVVSLTVTSRGTTT